MNEANRYFLFEVVLGGKGFFALKFEWQQFEHEPYFLDLHWLAASISKLCENGVLVLESVLAVDVHFRG